MRLERDEQLTKAMSRARSKGANGDRRPAVSVHVCVSVDVDECAEGLASCEADLNEECKNTAGGYVCDPICSEGHRYSVHFDKCLDIDECLVGTHTCESPSHCVNTEGSFRCKSSRSPGRSTQCPQGFQFDWPTRRCQDVDECREGTHTCRLPSQQCVNTNGSYVCRGNIRCPPGYRLNGNTRSCIGKFISMLLNNRGLMAL